MIGREPAAFDGREALAAFKLVAMASIAAGALALLVAVLNGS
jgi:hypothetical protein